MDRMKISKARLADWVAGLQQEAEVYAPVAGEEMTSFQLLPEDARPEIEYGNTDVPPKELLFPQTECLLRWKRTDQGLSVGEVDESRPIVIFGARPCDVTAIGFLDRAFALGGIVDPYYTNRREKATIVALVCTRPVPGCFGPSVGVNELSPEGADVVLTDIGDDLVAEAKTEKGEAAMAAGGDAFATATEDDLKAAEEAGQKLLAELAEQELAMDSPAARAAALLESPEWEQIWRRCLSCGICAFLCPTCHCFDICDQPAKDGGERIRCYDTCSSKLYTKQAAGHNPRPTPDERLTQRLRHKFDYAPKRLEGLLGCVGCGRCRRCPVDIDLQFAMSEVEVKES